MSAAKSPERELLARRIRDLLGTDRNVREVRMFGGLAFMVDNRLAVSAGIAGDLLVRVDPASYDELIERRAAPAFMGNDRPMGPGWLRVPGAHLLEDSALADWVEIGIDSRHAQP